MDSGAVTSALADKFIIYLGHQLGFSITYGHLASTAWGFLLVLTLCLLSTHGEPGFDSLHWVKPGRVQTCNSAREVDSGGSKIKVILGYMAS